MLTDSERHCYVNGCTRDLSYGNKRIFFSQLSHFSHQVNDGIGIATKPEESQHFLNDHSDVLSVRDPKEQLQGLREGQSKQEGDM